MTDSFFTPGPWGIIAASPARGGMDAIIIGRKNAELQSLGPAEALCDDNAVCVLADAKNGRFEANCLLICAAPLLYAALVRATETLVKYGNRDRNPDEEAWGAYSQAINALHGIIKSCP